MGSTISAARTRWPWRKLPAAVARAAMRGELDWSEASLAVAIAVRPGDRRSAWQRAIGAGRRAVSYALHGRGERPGLGRWLRGGSSWGDPERWVRVGERDLEALARRPTREAVQVWAWGLLTLESGAPWTAAELCLSRIARDTGLSVRRVRRAVWGAAGRLGAVALGLLRWSGQLLHRRHRLRTERPRTLRPEVRRRSPRARALRGPEGDPTLRAEGDPCVRTEALQRARAYFQMEIGGKRNLVALASAWLSERGIELTPQQTPSQELVSEWGERLCRGRVGRHAGRGWGRSILRAVLVAAASQVAELREASDRRRAAAAQRDSDAAVRCELRACRDAMIEAGGLRGRAAEVVGCQSCGRCEGQAYCPVRWTEFDRDARYDGAMARRELAMWTETEA